MPDTMFDLISARAFTSLWYWVVVVVYWGRVMQAPLNVPTDLLRRPRGRDGSERRGDAVALAAIHARRRVAASRVLGIWRAASWGFALSVLVVLGLGYGLELAQALLLLAAPSALVSWLTGRTAARIAAGLPEDDDGVLTLLRRLRARVQWVGTLAVFLTALWGSYHNLMQLVLRGAT